VPSKKLLLSVHPAFDTFDLSLRLFSLQLMSWMRTTCTHASWRLHLLQRSTCIFPTFSIPWLLLGLSFSIMIP